MKMPQQPRGHPSTWPIVTPFSVWFFHFMVIWTAGEIWPYQWTANTLAWGATSIALLAGCANFARIKTQHHCSRVSDWTYRLTLGASMISMTAVVFNTLPSLVFLP